MTEGELDPLFVEVTKWALTVFPQANLAMIAEFLVERTHPHGSFLTLQLGGRSAAANCSNELKKLLNSDDVIQFVLSFQLHSANSKSDESRWGLRNIATEIQQRFKFVKAFVQDLHPPSTFGPVALF